MQRLSLILPIEEQSYRIHVYGSKLVKDDTEDHSYTEDLAAEERTFYGNSYKEHLDAEERTVHESSGEEHLVAEERTFSC